MGSLGARRLAGGHAIVVDDGLGIEEVGQLLWCHPRSRIADGDLDIAVGLRGRDDDLPISRRELACIVSERVEHEECEHAVGLHLRLCGLHVEADALHLERSSPFGEYVEELLQGEGLDLQVEFPLAQLDPVGEYLVVVVDLVGEFADIRQVLLLLRLSEMARGIEHTVDEGGDGVDE